MKLYHVLECQIKFIVIKGISLKVICLQKCLQIEKKNKNNAIPSVPSAIRWYGRKVQQDIVREVKYFCWEELSKLGHVVAIYHDGIWKYGT